MVPQRAETLEEMEKRLGITRDCDDIVERYLGLPPSTSFYCGTEKVLTGRVIEAMRRKFDRAAAHYTAPSSTT